MNMELNEQEVDVESVSPSLQIPKPSNKLDSNLKKLICASFICLAIFLVQLIGGILANSLAIISDAAHMVSDLAAFTVSIVALILSKKKPTSTMTFGFHRYQVFGALLSMVFIWELTGWLVYKAVLRCLTPEEVDGFMMMIVALFGLLSNIIMGLTLHHPHPNHGHNHKRKSREQGFQSLSLSQQQEQHHTHGNLNVKAAFLHVVGDIIQNIGVLCASVAIWVQPEWKIVDPICTFFFSVIIVLITLPTFRECIYILLEKTPHDIDIEKLKFDLLSVRIKQVEEVVSVSEIYAWNLSRGIKAVSCHIHSQKGQEVLGVVTFICKEKYGFFYVTIQIDNSNQILDTEYEGKEFILTKR